MAETAPPTKSLAEQLDADLPAGATPEDLLKNMAIIKKKLIAAEAEKKALQEKVDSVEDADKKRRTEYAQKHAERAVAITEHMKEIAKLNGVDNLSKVSLFNQIVKFNVKLTTLFFQKGMGRVKHHDFD